MNKTLLVLATILALGVSQHVYSGYCLFDSCGSSLDESLTCGFENITLGETYHYNDWTNLEVEWTVSNEGTSPISGVCTDYEQWSVMDKNTWYTTGDSGSNVQDRDQAFTEGTCDNVFVADGDNYNCNVSGGTLQTQLTSPVIDITGAVPGSLFLAISESYRDYANQQKVISYSVDGGEFQVLQAVVSESPDWTSVTNLVSVPIEEGNTSVQFVFEFQDTENGWWWVVGQVGLVGFNCPEGQEIEPEADGIYCAEYNIIVEEEIIIVEEEVVVVEEEVVVVEEEVVVVVEEEEVGSGFDDSECVQLYTECNFEGDSQVICDEDPDIDLPQIKSIYVPEGVTFYFYDEINFNGEEVTLTESVECQEEGTTAFFPTLFIQTRQMMHKHEKLNHHHHNKHHHNKEHHKHPNHYHPKTSGSVDKL